MFNYFSFTFTEITKLLKIENTSESNEKIFVKIISPNFELKHNLSQKKSRKDFYNLFDIANSEEKKTLFVWPEGVFSGFSYNEI